MNLDDVVNRKDTHCLKWDTLEHEKDLPLWVADMDFKSPKAVIDALQERVAHGIYGYNGDLEEYYVSIINWMKKRHGWLVEKDWIVHTPGVVTAIAIAIQAFTLPGDEVIVQPPVYFPFFSSVLHNGRQLVKNSLIFDGEKYQMDFEDLENKVKKKRAKLLILCSPHNPVGRVWTKEELRTLGELCVKHNVKIISDEIHSDLIYRNYNHTPFASLSKAFAEQSIVCTAPSKTFNVAGIENANIIIVNKEMRRDYTSVLYSNGLKSPNTFGIVALKAAYAHGEKWLEAVMDYIEENFKYLNEFLMENLPEVKVNTPEGTFLVWLDFSKVITEYTELESKLKEEAHVILNQGYTFGKEGEGYVRINLACSRKILEEALNRIVKVFH